jgi:hypothetical protein
VVDFVFDKDPRVFDGGDFDELINGGGAEAVLGGLFEGAAEVGLDALAEGLEGRELVGVDGLGELVIEGRAAALPSLRGG